MAKVVFLLFSHFQLTFFTRHKIFLKMLRSIQSNYKKHFAYGETFYYFFQTQ